MRQIFITMLTIGLTKFSFAQNASVKYSCLPDTSAEKNAKLNASLPEKVYRFSCCRASSYITYVDVCNSFVADDQFHLITYHFPKNAVVRNYNYSDFVSNNVISIYEDDTVSERVAAVEKTVMNSREVLLFPIFKDRVHFYKSCEGQEETKIFSRLQLILDTVHFEVDGNSLIAQAAVKMRKFPKLKIKMRTLDVFGNYAFSDFRTQDYSEDDFTENFRELKSRKSKNFQSEVHNFLDYKFVEFVIVDASDSVVYKKTAFDNSSRTKLYPTMANNVINIETDIPQGAIKFTAINGSTAGEVIFEHSNAAIDISHLARGMYIANVYARNQVVYTTKIFKL